jgi:hypothetical protein
VSCRVSIMQIVEEFRRFMWLRSARVVDAMEGGRLLLAST